MPRPANNDPAVLLERANKERQRWKKAQEKYLERPENATKHKEAVKSYYEKNKEALKAKANERNAKKREAMKATATTAPVPEAPAKPTMEKAVDQLRKVEQETKKRNMRRKAEAGLQRVVKETAERNARRKKEASERNAMAMEDKDAPIAKPTEIAPVVEKKKRVYKRKPKTEDQVVIPKNEFVEEHNKIVHVLEKGTDKEQAKEAEVQKEELMKFAHESIMPIEFPDFKMETADGKKWWADYNKETFYNDYIDNLKWNVDRLMTRLYANKDRKFPLMLIKDGSGYNNHSNTTNVDNAILKGYKSPKVMPSSPANVKKLRDAKAKFLHDHNLEQLYAFNHKYNGLRFIDTSSRYAFKKDMEEHGDNLYYYDFDEKVFKRYTGDRKNVKFSNQQK